jgi:prevent-host-death family protein
MSAKQSIPPATVKAGEFKAKCLELMDQVAESGRSIVITKRGRAVAKLVPAAVPPASIFGFAKGSLAIIGEIVSALPGDHGAREDRVALASDVAGRPRRARVRTLSRR